MRLKHLELQGFKTFASKTEFVFPTGITAIVGPNGSGKCVTGDTLVTLVDGRDVPIRDLVRAAARQSTVIEQLADGQIVHANPDDIHVLSLNPVSLRLEPRSVAAFIQRTAPAHLLKIRTRSGREIIATPYHPLFTLEAGQLRAVKAEEIKAGIRVAVPRRLPVSGQPIDLPLLKTLSSFQESDNVYVPYSEPLRAWTDNGRTKFGTWSAWAQAAAVCPVRIKSIRDGQALNVSALVKLSEAAEAFPEIDRQLQSHTANPIRMPSTFTPDVARFLGLLIAEGRSTNSNQVWFVNSDPAINADFERLAHKVFELDVQRLHYKPGVEDSLIYSRTLQMLLARLFAFPINSKSADKAMPPHLLQAEADTQWAFLSGLFEGDAYICHRANTDSHRRQSYIQYTTASPQLARQVASILLRLGVLASIRSAQKHATNTAEKKSRTYYSVFIYGTEQLRYVAEHLAFVGEKDQALEFLRQQGCASNPNLDLVPDVTPLVKEAARLAKVNIKTNRANHPKLAAYVENRCDASRNGLLEVIEQIEQLGSSLAPAREHLKRLTTLATSDIYWDEIVSIEQVVPTDEWVYDLSIDSTHNFVAGNMIIHNSNVADAIRWVLGEQVFSVLRAKKTEDLVFAGSEHRPRSGMAEVYLTLDNSDGFFPIDFSEVVVGRRAYRDGENEYLLNGSKVRLRDVSELLSKTGLAQRTYTVIGQGLVDQALSLNSEERRALFEEAAGISMYRHKREDALRKLDETNRNLERVRDILAEIGPRVRQLERQAQRSGDYVRLSAELIEMQRTWFGYHWGMGQTALRSANDTVSAQSVQLNTRRDEMTALTDRIEAARQRQFDLRQQINNWQRESSGLRTQDESWQRQLAVLNERSRSLELQADQLTSDNAPLEAQAAAQLARIAQTETELAQLIDRTNTQAASIAAAQQALIDRQTQREAISRSRSDMQAAIMRSQAAQADRQSRRSDLAARRSILQRDGEAHQRDIDSRGQQLAALQSQRTLIENEITLFESQRADLGRQIDQLAQQLDAARQLAAQKETELNQARANENRLRERFKVLSEVRASLSSFDAGTRFVLNANISGVRGVLATLIEVDPKWERAIESALGADIQSVVIDSWEVAETIQAKLGETSGRVSLLPLDSVQVDQDNDTQNRGFFSFLRRESNSSPANISLPRGVKRATDFIKCDASLRPAIDLLLGNVVVAESLKEARELRQKLPYGVNLVTRKGELLRAIGTVILGDAAADTTSATTSFLAQQREWNELPDQIAQAAKATTTATEAHDSALKAIDAIVQQQTSMTLGSQSLDTSLTPKIDQRRTIEFQTEEVRREIGWQQGLIDQITQDSASIDQQINTLQTEEQQLVNEIQLHTQAIQQHDAQLLALPLDVLAAQLNSIQAEAAVADQLRRSQESVVASYKAALDQIHAQLQGRTARASQIDQEHQSIGQQIAEVQRQAESIQQQLAAFTAKIDPADRSLRELEIEQHQLETEERSARTRSQEMETLYNQAQVELARKEEELNHLHARIDEELGLVQLEMADLSGPQLLPLKPIVSELPTVESLPEGMDQELPRLKAQIRRLGPINPEAQREFEEARERFEFLTQQSSDLEKAIEQLNQVIFELDGIMQTSFRETFEKIAEEFKVQFQKLFGGGSAKLVLTDPDDISQTGIEVIARPPGKKQQSLALLSGGERSLTAAALMFSILRVKPPPFCILDETDAALDEANVSRFRDTIKALSDSTQFVIITHNRGTIEAADTIYGISMANDSASRAISLKLEAIKEQSA